MDGNRQGSLPRGAAGGRGAVETKHGSWSTWHMTLCDFATARTGGPVKIDLKTKTRMKGAQSSLGAKPKAKGPLNILVSPVLKKVTKERGSHRGCSVRCDPPWVPPRIANSELTEFELGNLSSKKNKNVVVESSLGGPRHVQFGGCRMLGTPTLSSHDSLNSVKCLRSITSLHGPPHLRSRVTFDF